MEQLEASRKRWTGLQERIIGITTEEDVQADHQEVRRDAADGQEHHQLLPPSGCLQERVNLPLFRSHLESLAKSYLYSPIFTERAAAIADPLERMKFSVILMISENALSIHMEKPFNPILGETFQGWIDGCPMYLEQISHHPPISAYYFLGRGYKKYGCMEPKVSVGLNSGSGYSIFPHYVEFEDGMKIEYVCAKIVIGGLLIG